MNSSLMKLTLLVLLAGGGALTAGWSPSTTSLRRIAAARRAAAPLLSENGDPHPALGDVELKGGAPAQQREMDPRGFMVPLVGDVVKMPSKWPGEWDVAQVDFVQFVGSRGAYQADLLPLKPMGPDTYRLPGTKPDRVTVDVAKLGKLTSLEYVSASDAWRIDPAELEPIGGRKQEDPDVTAAGLREYAELKAVLIRDAALLGAAGAAVCLPLFGGEVAGTFAAGAAAGCGYVWLLQRQADALAGEAPGRLVRSLVSGRLGVPVVLMAVLAARHAAAHGGAPLGLGGLLPKEQFLAAAAGFLAYKAPLLAREVAAALKELAEGAREQRFDASGAPTGSLGLAFKVAQSQLDRSSRARAGAEAEASDGAAEAAARRCRVVVASGPGGVGKRTLLALLLNEQPDRFGIPVSCTTRPPRMGETDGVDYTFLSDEAFDRMLAAGDFVEHSLGGERYGTSYASVRRVAEAGRTCLLDLDIKGVEAMLARDADEEEASRVEAMLATEAAEEAAEAKAGGLRPYCIWIAPPSLDALRARLRGRGAEDVEQGVSRATREIEAALSSRCFDRTVVNDDLAQAYAELCAVIDEVTV
jgi:guanylate kinase